MSDRGYNLEKKYKQELLDAQQAAYQKWRMMYSSRTKGLVIYMSQWEVRLPNRQECLLRFESDVTLQREGLSVSVSLLQNKVGSLGKNLTHHLCPRGEDVSSLCSLFLCVTCLYLKT